MLLFDFPSEPEVLSAWVHVAFRILTKCIDKDFMVTLVGQLSFHMSHSSLDMPNS